ncbi:hypothetical protein EUTSA_v10024534mg [Eutrema salsugineum]|uniref:DUF7812 domain-containing protein n=1 Tax=Eutrema salsugineum TaxID=72664 RepID=V4LV83_EUTSA|nr:uncharacterized protein LOC18028152 [Eutrema salsugineum]ESQ54520.1 hypothetical protein EUTSA_v10024534mg [Eutrema salsugineum]
MTAKRKVSDPGNLFRSLASAIASAQVSKLPIFKRLLFTLSHLSFAQPVNWETCDVASRFWNIKLSGEQVELISFEDVCNLSDVLFTELDRIFESLHSTLFKQNGETCPTFAISEERIELAVLFLRCCMKIMTLLLPKQELVLEKAKTLLSILSRLIHATNGDCSFVIAHDGSLDPRHAFLWRGLEAFMDEILVNKSIRDLLFLVDSAFSSCRLFSKHDRAGVVEMVSAHFIISTSDEKMISMCVDRLCWTQANAFTTPQISLCAALSLLQNPVISSAPRMIHAYVVLLVSEAIGICSPPCVKGSDLQLIDRYIDAFEKSVVLYTWNIRKGENGPSGKFGNSRVAFKHLLLPSTLEKVNHLTVKLKESWGAYQSNNAKRENSELVAYSVAYAKASSLCVFDSSCSENMLSQTLSILGSMILRASSDDVMDSVLQKYNASSMEDLYLLASTLKLMSYSMLQVIRVLRNCNWRQSEAEGDVRACKEYKAMMDVVQRFEQFSVHLPGQSFMRGRMESHPNKHVKSKWMIMHFSGLLSVSSALKLDFLMKNSIFGMVVSLYLFILEGGDMEELRDSVCHSERPSSSIPSSGSKDLEASGKAEETAVDRKLSGAVALKFQKSRTLYLGKMSEAKDPENCSDSGVAVEEETCNGERFLWCMAGKSNLLRSDVEELADFIACEPGKDYADWLKGRERFRNQRWKSDKIALQRWKKKQKAWRENKRKSS